MRAAGGLNLGRDVPGSAQGTSCGCAALPPDVCLRWEWEGGEAEGYFRDVIGGREGVGQFKIESREYSKSPRVNVHPRVRAAGDGNPTRGG